MEVQIKEGKTYLTVPHEGGKLTVQHPSFKGYYWNVAEDIDKEGLKRPTSPEIASLLYDAFQNTRGKYESEMMMLLDNSSNIWEFTGNLYLPKSNREISKGVIIEYNPEIRNGTLIMKKNSLIKRLDDAEEVRINSRPIFISKDKLVKFVPFGFNIEMQDSEEFEKNPYAVARYGEEGVHKIAEMASNSWSNLNVLSFYSVHKKIVRMSSFRGYSINGMEWSDLDGGYAFGVKR